MDKRTAKMIAYELASTILYDATYHSELSYQDERVKSEKDAVKIRTALAEILESLQVRHNEMEARSK